ncbi:MAG: hypothetical protein KOO60_00735 [Gemmatimonadales bacterium]|nr:hypothetical protein [Gemmatimonadales bacterium]
MTQLPNNVAALLAAMLLPILIGVGGCTDLIQNGLDKQVEGTLSRHQDGKEIERWYETLPPGSLEHDAARWILAWLPDSDLVSLDPVLLKEHVNLACDTYRRVPWRKNITRETWLHFVVPHRVSQEPLQPWRRVLQAELATVVAPYESMEEAALAVNRWCREQATYISTSGRDMGPLTTLKRGLGRCEEEMILTICAMRAAGIPARTCSTPYWTFTDDNHAWVEVWADDGWYYAESCDDRRCLNDAWFSGAASRAGFVRSVGYGEFDPFPEPLYRAKDGVTIVNSTAVYTEPFLLRASVMGSPETLVYVNVLNYGTIRSIASLDADTELNLGPGSFALTACVADESGDLLFKTITGEPGQTLEVQLDPATDRYDTATSPGFWLTYPEAGARPRRQEVCVTDNEDRHHRLLVAADKAEREKLRALDEIETAVLDSLPTELRQAWDEILTKPCESFSPLVRLLTWYRDPAERQALTWLLTDADDKDLLELDERTIRAHVDLSLAVRGDLPDDVFREGVLAIRINREPGGDWRSEMPVIEWSDNGSQGAIRQNLLDAFGDNWQVVDRTYFGNPVPPNHTFLLGSGTETDLKTAFVGLCRRNGVPARYRHGTVELWFGSWQEVDPLPQDDEVSVEEETVSAKAWIDLGLTRDGVAWSEAESSRHFMVSRPDNGQLESPWWDPENCIQEWDVGDYWFCATVRVPGGSAFGRLTRFEVEPGDTTVVKLPVDIDVSGWDPATLVDSDLEESLLVFWPEVSDKLPGAGLYFVFEPGEPATRMIPVVARLRERLAARDLPVIPVLVGPEALAPWSEKLMEVGLPGILYRPGHEAMDRWLADTADHGPVTLLILPGINDNRPVLLRSGLDNGIDFSVHLALDSHGRINGE